MTGDNSYVANAGGLVGEKACLRLLIPDEEVRPCLRTFQRWREDGLIPYRKIGGKVLFDLAEVRKALDDFHSYGPIADPSGKGFHEDFGPFLAAIWERLRERGAEIFLCEELAEIARENGLFPEYVGKPGKDSAEEGATCGRQANKVRRKQWIRYLRSVSDCRYKVGDRGTLWFDKCYPALGSSFLLKLLPCGSQRGEEEQRQDSVER